MNWLHPKKPGRRVRLAYCQNLHAADTLDETIAGIRGITLPLRDRLASGRDHAARAFGVGLYLPAAVARVLSAKEGRRELARFADFLAENALDPFTYNAFPFGGFHRAGLKAGVFRPTWEEEERVEFTLSVARIAAEIARRTGRLEAPAHISISTHSGRFGSFAADAAGEKSARACTRNMARVVGELSRIEEERGIHIVLAVEPEPRASAGDVAELASFLERAWSVGAEDLEALFGIESANARRLMRHHLGTCLDCCHAAVEFEEDAVERWNASGAALGKMQFSSALALTEPGVKRAGRDALLALDEPRYLHQVTGLSDGRRLRAADLSDLRRELALGKGEWERCSEWRCHFHVPVDLAHLALSDEHAATNHEHVARSREHVGPGREDVAPNREDVSPDREHVAPTREHVAPTRGDVAPRREDVAPNREQVAASREHVTPNRKQVASNRGAGPDESAALTTTRDEADRMLAEVLELAVWRPSELHLEIETYTWDILPGAARGSGSLVDGLEREYAHVMGELERAGWMRE